MSQKPGDLPDEFARNPSRNKERVLNDASPTAHLICLPLTHPYLAPDNEQNGSLYLFEEKHERDTLAMTLMQRFALPPDEIYRRSFATVDALLPAGNWSPEERHVLRRIIHATGDPQLAPYLHFKPLAIEHGIQALQRHTAIFTDVHMVAAGCNRRWCDALGCSIDVLIAQEGLEDMAQAAQITRSAAAIIKALPLLGGTIVVIGNAPTALLALLDALDEGRCEPPALIIGMPVGFIATTESKTALWERAYPAIIVEGTRGGSPVAAATLNALFSLALQGMQQATDPAFMQWVNDHG
ncbi:MAG: precorrin-8X methylmutase [Ktedonobacteraceae bacterium]|nr:precorrin-8X methylmutase [Ktedonobacteraceae bacterium]